MADQFCRIVDTTLTHTTLGSDSAQSILTTDANTSYVIRDVFQKNSCDNACLTMTGSLVMDGVTVASGISSSVAGSLIIPPSSNVCYVETSGNYPLTYNNIYIYPDVKAECNNNCKLVVCECTVNGLASGSVNASHVNTTSYWGALNICNFCQGGFWAQAPENCNYIMYCSDGNSTNVLRFFCCSGTAGCMCCSMNYCKGDYKDGMFMNMASGSSSGGCYKAYFPGCYQACCGAKCCMSVTTPHCGPTTYSSFGLSERINGDLHCRIVAQFSGQGCSYPLIMHYIDMTNCTFELIYKANVNAQNDCFCNLLYNPDMKLNPFILNGTVYLAAGSSAGHIDIAEIVSPTCRAVSRYNIPSGFDGCGYNISNGRLWTTSRNCDNACIMSVKLEDLLADQSEAPVTSHFVCKTTGCAAISHAGMTKVYYQIPSSPNPASFDINPSTKLAIYGIKST